MAVRSLLLLLFFLAVACCCPLSVKSLCKCELWFSGLHLDCSHLNFTEVLEVLQEAKSPIQTLIVHNTPIEVLPKDALGSLYIKQLDFAFNNMSEIEPGAFEGQAEVLEQLWIVNNSITLFPQLGNMPKLDSVDLSGNQIEEIPENVFDQVPNLKQLRLERNNICSLKRNSLNETKLSLELLDLSHNCFSSIPAQNLRGAQQLTYLDLSSNRLKDLPNLQFMNLPLLKEVRLIGNDIVTIQPLTFMNVPNLQHLYLSGNKIATLEPNRFQGFQKLELLDMSGNLIRKVPSSSFKEVASLKQLFLDDNAIESVETLAFSSNPKLQLISLQNNHISELYRNAFESCPQMIILLMANNSLPSVGRGVFEGMKNLQQLNLHNNKITSIESGAFDALPEATTLDLGENELANIPADAFSKLGKLFWLDLCCNQIQTFKQGTFTTKVANILLHDNPLECDDKLDWFVKYLVQYNVRTFLPGQPEVTCSGPKEYEGVRLKELMIKKANESFYESFNKVLPGGVESVTAGLPLLSQLLPSLTGLGNPIPGVTSQIPGLSGIANQIPGLNLLSGIAGTTPGLGFRNGNGNTVVDQAIQEQAVNRFISPLSRFITGNQPLASDVTDLIGSLPGLVQQLPQQPGSVGGIDVSKLSPELIQHVLNGGQIPGIPKAQLDAMVHQYMRQLAQAAQLSNSGQATAATSATLPPITDLPKELITQVLGGEPLPGLTASETEAIKAHYTKQLGGTTSPGTGKPSIITGIPPDELLNRLPADFDLGRLPSEVLQQVASGQTPDLSLLPADLLQELKDANPDLAQLETNGVVPETKGKTNIFDLLPETNGPVQPTYAPYDIGALDNRAEYKDAEEQAVDNHRVTLYTGVGLALVALVTVLVIAFFCYKRRTHQTNESSDQMRISGIYDTDKPFVPYPYSSPVYGFNNA